MKQYIKDNKILNQNKIVITVNNDGLETQIINPSEDILLEHGWVEYIKPEPTAEELLAEAKEMKVREIEHYDSSIEVNEFFINDIPVWLDKATRAGLMLRFQSELAMKKENTTLWYNDMMFELPINSAVAMLYAIENYASQCYDNTHMHISEINKLTTIDEIEAYNYRIGYPDKLHF